MAPLLIALYLMSITPLRLCSYLRWNGEERRLTLRLRVWGVQVRVRPLGKGKQRPLRAWLPALRAAGPALRLLRRGISVRRAEAAVRVGGDAAGAALAVGFVRALAGAWPGVQVRCDPAFGGSGALTAQCILEARLGTLWTAALLGAFLVRRARKKEGNA